MKNVSIAKGFWADRQATNRDKTLPAIYHQLQTTGRFDAWNLDWKPGQPVPHIFWDSDIAKWAEAVGYSLETHPNPEFEREVDAIVHKMHAGQYENGYLNSHFIQVEPQNRWANLRDQHELYCAGHLMEGAVAYTHATGKTEFLDMMRHYADHIDATFGPGEHQKHGYPGHPEAELALVKLYRSTNDPRYLRLSQYFVDERGQKPHYFDLEAVARGDNPRNYWAQNYRYCQADVPIRDQHTAMGHSVRACYLYSGVADVALETNDPSLRTVMQEIWTDLTTHQMYITGGLGPAHTNEGFTFAYDLPNENAYAETCASIALAFWAQRMFLIDPASKYIDVMERALYNGILSGVSYEGTHFFYANPLSSYPYVNPYQSWSGITSDHYYRRSEWFDCACCPPNLARIVAGIGNYFYSSTADRLYVHLYNSNHAHFHLGGSEVHLDEQTDYPWDGTIHFGVQVDSPARFDIALRIPDWCRDFKLEVNGAAQSVSPERGYVVLSRQWSSGDQITLTLAMPVERMLAHPDVRQDAGDIALQRGPIVYCLEEVDNGSHLANVSLPRAAKLAASVDANLFGGVAVISSDALRHQPANWSGGLYQSESTVQVERQPFTLKAIPYFLWANREPGEMTVWLREE
ncbi:MAG TPA: beta-L-arabinofuranosidase domain-containing protein [Phototrophicaceae bacterium]|nr:beta-L-arabinofuranosidase domain-containing protein [Phototrophicaceae bacterium]